MSREKALATAIIIWKHFDEPLPLDVAAALIDAGYDVEALERKYRQ